MVSPTVFMTSTSLFCCSRTLLRYTETLRREVGAPGSAHPVRVLSGSVASYLCYFMLTCGCTFRCLIVMTGTKANPTLHAQTYGLTIKGLIVG